MKPRPRTVVVVLLAAVLLIVAGWIVTVVLFKSGGRVEEPHQLALQLSR
jgi:drug/metabolite transporter superfamily protein YnfA